MFSSLRSRLWLSYALVCAAALAVVASVFLIYIIQNPSTYRQESARLTVVSAILRKNETEWENLSFSELKTRLDQVDSTYATRIALYNTERKLIYDSQSALRPALQFPRLPRLRSYSIEQDQNGNRWLYMLRRLSDGRWLLISVPRPAVPLLTILTDELILPVLGAGIIAMVISLLVAFWLARWIGDPLQRVIAASKGMPSEQTQPVAPNGPREVQELTRAFNEMNARVQTSQKSQREFVANVSHELKTPLTSIQGFAQALLDGTAETAEARKQAEMVIFNESGRMHRMVLDLLDLARLDAGTLELQRAPVDLNALLNSIVEKFTPQSQAGNINIHLDASDLPVITGDGDRLSQVFTNLIENALKFSPSNGIVTVRTALAGSGIQVEVVDNGVGISPEALPHIFDRFFQADPSRSGGRRHGAGLGLAIAKEIVSAHGGKINARSEQGMGSTFTVILPLPTSETSKLVSRRNK